VEFLAVVVIFAFLEVTILVKNKTTN